jgi:serine protease
MRFFISIIITGISLISIAGNNADEVSKFVPNTIIVKVKPEYRQQCSIDKLELPKLFRLIPEETTQQQLFPYSFSKDIDISLIYELHAEGINSDKLMSLLFSTGYFDYVEYKVINHLDFIPNDELIAEQWYLDTINAFEAWDIEQGDTNIVVGIIDTGIDLDHEDLSGAIKYNYADPIDGADNDGDGYIDNFNGWDMSDNDNSPMEPASFQHGTQVAGCVAPVTNNSIGIAGVGYKCKILPIKAAKDASSASSGLDKGYEGVVYAADHGANIINCSWGSSYASQYGKDIIDYATTKGCLVVAAAGNTSSEAMHYPAAFEGVLAVANTLSSDVLAPSSGRGHWVDISSPGSSIKTTFDGGTFESNSGTSFSAPITAGCAALVLSKFDSYSPQEIIERLKATSHNIYSIPENSGYIGKMGDGRVDIYKALSEVNLPSIIVTNYEFDDGNDNLWKSKDTIALQVSFTNVLDSTGGLKAELNSISGYINIIDSTADIGSLNKSETKNNLSSLFKFEVLAAAPFNETIVFSIDITSDNGYIRSVPFAIDVNNYFVDVTINELKLTVSSDGQIGYYEEDQASGLGITYKNSSSLLYNASFMVGVPGKVADMTRGISSSNDKDFIVIEPVKSLEIATFSDFDVSGVFSDSIPFNFDQIGVEVRHNTYAWDKSGHQDYIIQEYTIINRTSEEIDSLYAGIFADWDIGTANNFIDSDFQRGFGYCYEPNGIYTGIKELTHWKFSQQAMYNVSGEGGNINPNGVFSSNIKYKALTEFYGWAGNGSGQDVSHIVSAGPYSIIAKDSVTVAFAIMAGDNLLELKQTVDSAFMQYNGKQISSIKEVAEFRVSLSPNPFKYQLNIAINNSENYQLKLLNNLGQEVLVDTFSRSLVLQRNSLPIGVYFISISQEGIDVFREKVIVY